MPVFSLPRKTTKGYIYYKPLKMPSQNLNFKDYRAKAQEEFADNSVKEFMGLTFR
jgi:hypothetical protein